MHSFVIIIKHIFNNITLKTIKTSFIYQNHIRIGHKAHLCHEC